MSGLCHEIRVAQIRARGALESWQEASVAWDRMKAPFGDGWKIEGEAGRHQSVELRPLIHSTPEPKTTPAIRNLGLTNFSDQGATRLGRKGTFSMVDRRG